MYEKPPNNTEKEPQLLSDEEIRARGYFLKEISDKEKTEHPIHCHWEKGGDCFEDAEWFVEGSPYCGAHKQSIVRMLSENEKQK